MGAIEHMAGPIHLAGPPELPPRGVVGGATAPRNVAPQDLELQDVAEATAEVQSVFSPDGALVEPQLAGLLNGMSVLLPKPGARYPRAQKKYQELQQELTEMTGVLRPGVVPRVSSDLYISRGFAGLALKASKLMLRDGDNPAQWENAAALLNELKRIHFTYAAPSLQEQHAAAEVAAMNASSQGVGQKLGGSLIETSAAASVGVSTSGVFSGSASGGHGTTVFADDNRQIQHYHYTTISAGATAGLPGVKLSFSIGARIGPAYLQSPDLTVLVKARTNQQANRSVKEKLLRHTTSPFWRGAHDAVDRGVGYFHRYGLGRGYRPPPGKPTYVSDAKLAKGYNTTKLHLLARALDGLENHDEPGWQTLIHSAYPAPADLVRHCVDNQAPLPADSPINRSVPSVTVQGRGPLPYRESATPFGVALGVAGPKAWDGFAQVMLGGDAALRHTYRQL